MGFFADLANRPDQPVQDVSNAPMAYDTLAKSATPNGWAPDVGDWFNGVNQKPYDAAIDGPVGAPVDRNRFQDFLNAHQISPDEWDSKYGEYLSTFGAAQAEQQQYQADPAAYNSQKTTDLANALFSDFTANGHTFGGLPNPTANNTAELEAYKSIDPNAYYRAMLHLDMQKAGWDAGQGKTNDVTNARIQDEIKNGLAAGIPQEQIQNYIKYDYGVTAEGHAKNIAQRQGQGAFLQGIEKVAPAFAALATAGFLAPAAGALEAGSVAAGVAPEIAGSGFYTGAGFGAEGLGTAAGSALAEGAATQALPYTEAFDASNLASQGLNSAAIEQNLVGTGLNSFLSADMASLAAQGLNPAQIEATLAASYTPAELAGTGIQSLNWGATQGLSAADLLKYANQARQGLGVASTLSKLLGGGAGGATGGATGGARTGGTASGTGGLSPQDLAKYLYSAAPAQAGPVPYQIKMNQNPFTFNIPGQTQATQGMYDVSGVNPMANALRKL
jgi:hypothetical protein